jgi:hypothetical protein
MSFPPPPGHQSTTLSEGWVFVESSHTKSRSPQLIVDNMPSRQVANASATASSSIVLSSPEPEPANTTTTVITTTAAPYHPNHIPPSTGGDSASTETAGTDDTTTPLKPATTTAANNPTTATPFYYHHYPLAQPADPTPPAPQLTHFNMTLHQRELAHHWTGSLAGWVDDAGAGVVGTRYQGRYEESAAAYSNMATVGGGGGGGAASGSSVAGTEWVPVQSQEGGEELFAMGAWAL